MPSAMAGATTGFAMSSRAAPTFASSTYHPEPTPPAVTDTSSASTTNTLPPQIAGAIGGAVAGGIVLILLLVFWCVRGGACCCCCGDDDEERPKPQVKEVQSSGPIFPEMQGRIRKPEEAFTQQPYGKAGPVGAMPGVGMGMDAPTGLPRTGSQTSMASSQPQARELSLAELRRNLRSPAQQHQMQQQQPYMPQPPMMMDPAQQELWMRFQLQQFQNQQMMPHMAMAMPQLYNQYHQPHPGSPSPGPEGQHSQHSSDNGEYGVRRSFVAIEDPSLADPTCWRKSSIVLNDPRNPDNSSNGNANQVPKSPVPSTGAADDEKRSQTPTSRRSTLRTQPDTIVEMDELGEAERERVAKLKEAEAGSRR